MKTKNNSNNDNNDNTITTIATTTTKELGLYGNWQLTIDIIIFFVFKMQMQVRTLSFILKSFNLLARLLVFIYLIIIIYKCDCFKSSLALKFSIFTQKLQHNPNIDFISVGFFFLLLLLL